jgi:hypothetical protein
MIFIIPECSSEMICLPHYDSGSESHQVSDVVLRATPIFCT